MDSSINVLIVDDRSNNILLLTELLKNLGVNMITATSGREALDKICRIELALALLDVQMPEMNGHELAVLLNKNRGEHIPIIFLTATYPESDQILEGYAVGAVDYLVKPFKPEVLISKAKVFIKLFQQKKEIAEIARQLILTSESLSKANKSLLVSQEEYRTLMNASPDGILLIKENGIITDFSNSCLSMFGVQDKSDLFGKHYLRFVPKGEEEKILKITTQLNKKGFAQDIVFTLKKQNGTCFPSETSFAKIEHIHESTKTYILLIRDITLRKSIESQLIHSERLASLGEMASGMAHEINQPLNTISLAMDNLILEASLTDRLPKDYFEKKTQKIFENIQRIRNLIDHVRLFSRSQKEYINNPFDINECVQNALCLMNEQIQSKGIKLKVNLDDQIPHISGNMLELEQVIINLISNAKDALLEKELKMKKTFDMYIFIQTRMDKNNIHIIMKDNGIGMKHDIKSRIFLPFFSTKLPGKGTGLGLSISYTIVKNMNGDIRFDSQEMKGSQFQITFPIHKKPKKDGSI